jgi:hypothetical protein
MLIEFLLIIFAKVRLVKVKCPNSEHLEKIKTLKIKI